MNMDVVIYCWRVCHFWLRPLLREKPWNQSPTWPHFTFSGTFKILSWVIYFHWCLVLRMCGWMFFTFYTCKCLFWNFFWIFRFGIRRKSGNMQISKLGYHLYRVILFFCQWKTFFFLKQVAKYFQVSFCLQIGLFVQVLWLHSFYSSFEHVKYPY